MRIFILLALLLPVSCAHRRGATYVGGQIASSWSDTTFGTDLDGASTSAEGMKIVKQNQSTVANQFIKTGGQAIAAYVGADVIKSVTNSNNAVTTAESGNALKATQAKEVTKRAADANKTAVETAKIHAETLP